MAVSSQQRSADPRVARRGHDDSEISRDAEPPGQDWTLARTVRGGDPDLPDEADPLDLLAAVPGLTVGGVARRLGVAPATLRTWARRYGMGPTAHVAGSHRRYSAEDVARLDLMRRMVDAGVSPGDAARAARSTSGEVLRRREEQGWTSVPADVRPGADVPADRPGPTMLDLHELTVAGPTDAPGAELSGAGALARAALALDGARCAAVIADEVGSRGVVRTWDELLAPILVGVGSRWEHSGAGVEVEHVLCESITVAMAAVWSRPYRHRNARPILLACAPDEAHSLVLRVVAAALAEEEIYAQPIGVGLPTRALVAAVRRAGPAAVMVWSSQRSSADASDLSLLAGLRPTPLVLAGGPGWASVPYGVTAVRQLYDVVTLVGEVVG